ncbi:MAG TPA: protein kinase [Ktedonobacteraceae bacterium]|nr:protein kinase [Ktedonobacteraceae bacterium]
MPELTGATIEHYYLQSRLTRGGMSEIYLAYDDQTQHTVAVKLVHSSNKDYCERFKREVQVIGALSHDNILPTFAAGEYGDWCYLVMPYIEYGTLEKKLANGPLSLKEAGIILEQLSSALQHAHDQNIIHRDIKPTNVLLRDGEHVYLADFGLVKRVGEDNGLTVTGYVIGTPEYMAPELAEEPASTSSDLYALGVLLYKMLTGHLPFTSNNPIGTLLKHIKERPQPPSTLNPAIPECIDEVILRALEKEPRHRYKSVRELSQAYWQAFHMATLVAAAEQVKDERPTSILNIGHGVKPSRRVVFAMVAAFMLCLVPFALGLTLSSNDNKTSAAQPVHTLIHTTRTTQKKTSAGTSPIKTPTPTHPITSSSTTTTAKTVPSPVSLAPSTFTQNSGNGNYYNNQDNHQNKRPHKGGKGHGKSNDQGSQNDQGND